MPVFEDSGRCRGMANITFSSAAEATAAKELNGFDLNGRILSVEESVPKEKKAFANRRDGEEAKPPSSSIFIGNLSFEITEDALREAFAGT